MLCQRCKKNKANTVFTQTINGKTVTEHICSDCAGKVMNATAAEFGSWFDEFPFAGFMSMPRAISNKRCESCGMSFDEIMEAGRLGCAECYSVFASELAPTIQNIHGKSNHIGKRPRKFKKALTEPKKDDERIAELKEKLKQAIDEQNFEKAAEYRDEINRLS